MDARYRPHDVTREDRADGAIILRARAPVGPVARRATDWLEHWAAATPGAVFLAERSGAGWREVTYAAARDRARALAAGLLDLGLGPDAPLLILSGNSVDHGLLALAAQYIGAPFAPLAEQYALIPAAHGRIDHAAGLIRPAAVFAEDGDRLAGALALPSLAAAIKIVSRGGPADAHHLSALEKGGGDVEVAHALVGPETVAKVLLTSGSTSAPKGVPTTQAMMCVNQTQLAHALPFVTTRPPVIVDWLPWNHVFGGSHNFNLALANGGALYIDDGKPTPQLVGRTIENLRLKTGTIAFNVPAGFAAIRDELRRDADLRRRYFADLDMLFYAGASLPQDIWDDLAAMAREVLGEAPLITSSWGLTETAPGALLQHQPCDRSGVVGVPLPGCEVKLTRHESGRHEVRVRGPNIFSGYLGRPAEDPDTFDEEGFFRTGDAMRFVDPDDMNLGLRFDGRLSEDFKLLSGTWVRAAALRLAALDALGDMAADVVVLGADRAEVGLFIFPAAALAAAADAAEDDGALIVPSAAPEIARRLAGLGGSASTSVARALILAEPPQVGDGELTAKGSLNTAAILSRRAALLARCYAAGDAAVIDVKAARG